MKQREKERERKRKKKEEEREREREREREASCVSIAALAGAMAKKRKGKGKAKGKTKKTPSASASASARESARSESAVTCELEVTTTSTRGAKENETDIEMEEKQNHGDNAAARGTTEDNSAEVIKLNIIETREEEEEVDQLDEEEDEGEGIAKEEVEVDEHENVSSYPSSSSSSSSSAAATLEQLVRQKVSLQEENDFLLSELTATKVELAELKMINEGGAHSPSSSGNNMSVQRMPSMRTLTSPAVTSMSSTSNSSSEGEDDRGGSSSGGAATSTRSRLAGCLVVSGANSGVGKTTIASLISLALVKAGVVVQPFKVGPDFLDGKHLEHFCQNQNHAGREGGGGRDGGRGGTTPTKFGNSHKGSRPCVNLDGWLLGGKEQCIDAFHCALRTKYDNETGQEPIVAVVEGCMGLYDGRDGQSEVGSTAEIAKWLRAPVVLVLECSAMARSAAAQLRGFQVFDEDVQLIATVLNKVYMSGVDRMDMEKATREDIDALYTNSPHVQWLQEAIGTSATILGTVPSWKSMEFPERHLGLQYPSECKNARSLELIAENFLDPNQLLRVARNARLPKVKDGNMDASVFPKPIARIGVAFDEAFCFYYHDNLLLLGENGAELVYFSPLHDSELPENIQALYLGGGYPENFAARLEENHSMREEILAFASSGGIVYAECGGLMYLSKSLEVMQEDGTQQYCMVGIFPFRTRMTKKASLGYVSVNVSTKNGLFPADVTIRGQFFHFSEVVEERVIGGLHSKTFSNGSADESSLFPTSYSEIYDVQLEGVSSSAGKSAKEGYNWKNVLASFVHLHFRSNPHIASHFVGVCSLVDAEELGEKLGHQLRRIQSSASNEMYLNPIYTNLKSMSSVESKNSSSDGALSLDSAGHERGLYKSNGTHPHERCASWSNIPQQDYSMPPNVRKGLSYNDNLSSLPSSGARISPGFYKGARGSYSYADFDKLRRTMSASPSSASGFENVSYITIPSELAICTLSPQATEMVCALGLQERLVAITDLCDYPINIHQGRHIVSESKLKSLHNHHFGEGDHLTARPAMHMHGRQTTVSTARQIDSKLSEIRNKKETLFNLDVAWLSITRPGTIITQDTCVSCSPDSTNVVTESLVQAGLVNQSTKQPVGCSVLNLKAYILSDMFRHLLEIGSTCNAYENAVQLVTMLRHRLRNVAHLVSRASYKPRVISFEGISPLVLGGHWLPEMKTLAGGIDPLQEPGSLSQRVNWQKVRACAPEILILTPCSSSPLQTLSEVNILASMPGWWSIPAVYKGEVYIVDHAYFSRPGPRLVDGIELLAHLFHPDLVKLSPREETTRNILKFTLRNGQRCNPKQLASHFKPYETDQEAAYKKKQVTM